MFLRSRCACSSAVLCRYKLRRTKLKFEFTIYTFFAKWLVFRLWLRYLRCSRKLFSNTQISRSVVSFDFIFISFHFISPHSILYLEDTHFSPFLSYIFSVTIIIIIIVISFVCENQNVCSFLFGLAYALPFARQLATTKNVQFIYCFTCSLYAVRILKMHFSLSQHPHNLLLGE